MKSPFPMIYNLAKYAGYSEFTYIFTTALNKNIWIKIQLFAICFWCGLLEEGYLIKNSVSTEMFDSVGYLLKSILDRRVGGGAAKSMFDLRTHSLQEDATLHCLVNLHLGWQHGVAICGLVYILYRSIWLELFICFWCILNILIS